MSENFRRRALERITLTYYGGRFNGRTDVLVGAPQFTVGGQYVLFLSSEQATPAFMPYMVVGLAQGKFNIFTDTETKEQKIIRDQINVPLQLEKNGPRLDLTSSKSMKLADFKNQIRALIN